MREREPNLGIVGTHVQNSLSPVMHNAAYQEMGLDLHYGFFQVPEMLSKETRLEFFDAFLKMQAELGVIGMSVTMPFKEDIINSNQNIELSETVKNIGAANTISNRNDWGWKANNTDWLGAVISLEEAGMNIKNKTILVIGAGGTARAVTYGLGIREAQEIIIANRTEANAIALAKDLQPYLERTHLNPIALKNFTTRGLTEYGKNIASEVDIIYNTTNIGQDGTSGQNVMPFSLDILDLFKNSSVVDDAVYIPIDTPLVRLARERGLKVVDGTRMLLHQAVEQIKIFTGETDVPVVAMDQALNSEIKRRYFAR